MKCLKCNHSMEKHSKYVGCMYYDITDKRLTEGYCSCKTKPNNHLNKKQKSVTKR